MAITPPRNSKDSYKRGNDNMSRLKSQIVDDFVHKSDIIPIKNSIIASLPPSPGDNWGSQVAITSGYLTGDGTIGSPLAGFNFHNAANRLVLPASFVPIKQVLSPVTIQLLSSIERKLITLNLFSFIGLLLILLESTLPQDKKFPYLRLSYFLYIIACNYCIPETPNKYPHPFSPLLC